MNIRQIAKVLGRRGGLARAKRLSATERKSIASLGGQMKSLSYHAVQRIEDNLAYLKTLRALKKPPRVHSVSRVTHLLPGIYAK